VTNNADAPTKIKHHKLTIKEKIKVIAENIKAIAKNFFTLILPVDNGLSG
jgi:hypothetical protein